jgi:SAM-dependent methyltransferase
MGSAELQGALWSAGARDWSQFIEPTQVPFYEAAFDAIGVGPGVRLLDAGCGSGLALVMAKDRGALPTGLDAAVGLLEVARERLPDADLRQGDLEEMPFDDDLFDAVTAFNSVQFAADATQALREMRRVAAPGAPITVTTWGPPELCEMAPVLGSLGALLPLPPAGVGGPFALSAPGAVESLMTSAGLSPEDVIDVATPFVFPSLDLAVRVMLSTGPGKRAVDVVGEPAALDALAGAFSPHVRDDGTLSLDNVFRVRVARA